MSPPKARGLNHFRRFPRVSGDEPAACRGAYVAALFSPRERG